MFRKWISPRKIKRLFKNDPVKLLIYPIPEDPFRKKKIGSKGFIIHDDHLKHYAKDAIRIIYIKTLNPVCSNLLGYKRDAILYCKYTGLNDISNSENHYTNLEDLRDNVMRLFRDGRL